RTCVKTSEGGGKSGRLNREIQPPPSTTRLCRRAVPLPPWREETEARCARLARRALTFSFAREGFGLARQSPVGLTKLGEPVWFPGGERVARQHQRTDGGIDRGGDRGPGPDAGRSR